MSESDVFAIRPATPDDVDFLVGLSDQLEMAASSKSYTPRPIDERRPKIMDALTSEHATVLIAMLGDTAVGYVNAVTFPNFKGRREGKIVEIVVDNNLRTQGIGTRLFNAALDDFKDAGVEVFEVTTGENNEAAKRFYEKQSMLVDEVVFRRRL